MMMRLGGEEWLRRRRVGIVARAGLVAELAPDRVAARDHVRWRLGLDRQRARRSSDDAIAVADAQERSAMPHAPKDEESNQLAQASVVIAVAGADDESHDGIVMKRVEHHVDDVFESWPWCHEPWPGSRHHNPTRPVTDAMSLAGSNPTPCLKTVSTLWMSAIVVAGSPAMTIRSACLPVAIDPM